MPLILAASSLLLGIAAAAVAMTLPGPTSLRPAAPTPPRRCLISDHVTDPSAATAGIQAAVEVCSVGGTFLFDVPNATYVTGAVRIAGRSIHLRVPPRVTLLAGTAREYYPGPQPDWHAFHFLGCEGCSLGGGGTLDGRARDYVTGRTFDRKLFRQFTDPSCFNPWECRPRMLGVINCTAFRLLDFHFVDPPYWTIHVLRSHAVSLTHFSVHSDWKFFNTDGLDIDSSTDVDVADCRIDTAGNAVYVKTTAVGHPVAGCACGSVPSAPARRR